MLGPGPGPGCPGPDINVTMNRLNYYDSGSLNLLEPQSAQANGAERASCRVANTYRVLALVSRLPLSGDFQLLRRCVRNLQAGDP